MQKLSLAKVETFSADEFDAAGSWSTWLRRRTPQHQCRRFPLPATGFRETVRWTIATATVPDLTSSHDIKLNPRLRLQPHLSLASFSHTGHCPVRVHPKAKSSRQHIRRGASFDHGPFQLEEQSDHEALDLVEMRRQLTALRSRHSNNLQIASLLNRFLVKVAFLTEPTDFAHEQYLRSEFERTLKRVEAISARTKSG
ncbi:hypothetical protein [Bradyrhizobium sp. ERR14]|uniref:hypothetical protein n=1 Tax=Bradyrhizobium sp. ERR14 TaxID=2663837 RepID=UPI00182A70A0|nr:hypothetical protein [Bradyrhizobium sp. ERR14]MBB4398864.1 hypothetical protein [Bradyrhizobium sp. ERR14]